MNKVLAGSLTAVLLPTGIIAAMLAAPASAETTPLAAPGGEAASAEMLAAMQRDLGLTKDAAKARIVSDDSASRKELALRKKLGAAFGGAWLGADAKTLVVAVTDSAKAAEVTAAGATPTVVDDSIAKLDAIKAGLDKAAAKAPAATVPGWYVDVKTNTVVVQALGSTTAATSFIKAAGVDAAEVKVVATTEKPRLLYDVRGGDAYYIGGGRCSVGFSVNGGFVTAGHCGRTGSATTGFNRVAQGTFQGSSFPGNDYAWVSVNANWTPQPWVNNYAGGNVTVAGSTVAAIGAAICRSGSTTGWKCGTVQAYNQTVNYAEGSVSGLTRTNACAEPGDSGGSWLSGQQAQGVTSGGSGNCTSGGTTYFQPVNEILQAYGRTLVTSGGGTPPTTPPTTPPSSGCNEFTVRGTLSSGGSVYQPSSGYSSTSSGAHRGCLTGPSGTDFDLYLQKRSGTSWVTVAQGITPAANETVTYNGTAGTYRWRVHAYSGSGSYTLTYTNP